MRHGDVTIFYTIYCNPSDHPGKFVTRRHCAAIGEENAKASTQAIITNTLEGARALLPAGLTNLGREPEDDPVIVETWM